MPPDRVPSAKKSSPLDAETEFLASYDPGPFAKPSVAVDVVLLGIGERTLRVLLVRRTSHPHRQRWALPGGFVRLHESLDVAAGRVLAEKAGIENVYLEQLYTFGRPDRDPRMRIISVGYVALVKSAVLESVPAAENARLFSISAPTPGDVASLEFLNDRGEGVKAAFDHVEIVATALNRLRGKIGYAPVGYELLPETFTLFQLQRVHEIILSTRLNKDSFRRKMLASGELEQTGKTQDEVDHRPAALYRRKITGSLHDIRH